MNERHEMDIQGVIGKKSQALKKGFSTYSSCLPFTISTSESSFVILICPSYISFSLYLTCHSFHLFLIPLFHIFHSLCPAFPFLGFTFPPYFSFSLPYPSHISLIHYASPVLHISRSRCGRWEEIASFCPFLSPPETRPIAISRVLSGKAYQYTDNTFIQWLTHYCIDICVFWDTHRCTYMLAHQFTDIRYSVKK